MKTLVGYLRLITLGLLSLSFSTLNAQPVCSVEKMAGKWIYSQQGTNVRAGGIPFSELGWFEIEKNGTGRGEAFISVGGQPIPPSGQPGTPLNPGIPLNVIEVTVNPDTCIGRGAFIPGTDTSARTITFVVNSKMTEFRYISTTGDLTILGTAKKDQISRND